MPNPLIFDRSLLRRRRSRVKEGRDFLLEAMAERLRDRLHDVAREFPLALELGARSTLLADHPQVGRLVQLGFINTDVIGDEEWLPFAPETFDLVLSCGALHWVNDLPGTLAQVANVLKPDGLFLAILPGGETLHQLRDALMKAELAQKGGASPRVSPFIDVREAGGLLQRAGFALPVVDVERLTVRYENPLSLMQDLKAMGEANVLKDRTRIPLKRSTLLAAAQAYQEEYAGADGRVPATFELVTLTGWKPHASQPIPAQRGSGKTNLRDVLK